MVCDLCRHPLANRGARCCVLWQGLVRPRPVGPVPTLALSQHLADMQSVSTSAATGAVEPDFKETV